MNAALFKLSQVSESLTKESGWTQIQKERAVKISPLAGKQAPLGMLVDVPRLVTAYYTEVPDPAVLAQRVALAPPGIVVRRSS